MAVTAVSMSEPATMVNAALLSAERMATIEAADMPTCAMPATVATAIRHRGDGAHTR
jgi:hypothetical protein